MVSPAPLYTVPDDDQIRNMLERAHRIAVLGLSPKPNRPSHRVARALQGWGYQIIPVRPAIESVLGEKACATLGEVSGPVDLVDVFRAPEHVPAIVEECITLGIKMIWLQEGVVHEEAAIRAQSAGLEVVMDRCIYKEYKRLFGDQPKASW